jgi:N-acetylglucosamine kinase-like BadF-type ATPase
MILIADSGASKTDWRMINGKGEIAQAQTIGFNPYYQPIEQFEKEVRESLLPQLKDEPKKIFYDGTGCSSDKNRQLVRSAFEKFFANTHIEVWHDLLAAARALCGSEEGIACILGTGANSCFYDGSKITDNVTSLGYLLGDEGSGAYLGKRIVGDYLRKDLPEKLWDQFKKRFPFEKEDILDRVYNQEMPSKFLGINGGQVYGKTSDDGNEVTEGQVGVGDVLVTLCRALGVDPSTENISELGRPIKIAEGTPIEEILA